MKKAGLWGLAILLNIFYKGWMLNARTLPKKLVIGYANWSECDDQIIEAAVNGVNVIIWFSINLKTDSKTGLPLISGGPNYTCVAEVTKKLKLMNLPTVHLISIGGWNSPHPDTKYNGSAYQQKWNQWNIEEIANPEFDFQGFDGFDWDLEDLMGEMSTMAKSDGQIVSMAPAESYLDVTTNEFDRSLLHNYAEWEKFFPKFNQHGHNVQAYLIAKQGINTFDFISVQFYESYSHILQNVSKLGEDPSEYLIKIVSKYYNGWIVNLSSDPETHLENQKIRIPKEKFIIGLANAWAHNWTIQIEPQEFKKTYEVLSRFSLEPRGFMQWDIADEGKEGVYLAEELNKFMHTRGGIYSSKFRSDM